MSNLHHLGAAVPSSSPAPTAGAFETPHASDAPADTSLTPRLRDGVREARTVPAGKSALGHGLMLEVRRLRDLCRAHGIDPDGQVPS